MNQAGNEDNTNKHQNGTEPRAPLASYSVPNQPQQEEESPYYKSQAPSISLPKGGGAIKSIDEKFSINAVNGTAGMEIPLPLTPGRGGFTPALSLSYSSGGGNSEFGLGWSLSLPSIQRRTDKQLPLYKDNEESDVFLLAGAEDLVPELDENGERVVLTQGVYVIKRYRPRIEGLFARIEQIRKQGDTGAWWRVTTRDNITTYYGLDASCRITDPEYGYRIFRWLPTMTIDHKGNVQRFFYKAEDTVNVPDTLYEKNRKNGLAPVANTYLKRVRYGNKEPYFITADVFEPELPATEYLFEAVLDYGDHSTLSIDPDSGWSCRQDAFSGFQAGFEIRTWRKCRRVLMFHTFDELNNGAPTLVRSLDLAYEQDTATTPVETDYIIRASVTGYRLKPDGLSYYSRSLPPIQLKYTPLKWNTQIRKVAPEELDGIPQGLTGPYQWIDFEGEGISGILTEQGDSWFYNPNLGEGRFAGPEPIASKPAYTGLGSSLQWQDLNADGRRQVVMQSTDATGGYWELDGPDAATEYHKRWLPFRPFDKHIFIDWSSPFTLMLDLNGDGKADALITEDMAWTWWENEGTRGYDYGGRSPVYTDEEKGPALLLRDAVQCIFLADMNGDGLTDLVRIRNGEVCYWPNKGYGQFGAKTTMANAPHFQSPDLFNPQYILLADISGTGAADIIYTGKNRCTAWINLAGNAFGDAFDINPLPATDAYSKLAVLDFLGNGTGCLVWSSPLPHHATAPMQYIDLMGGHKPYLLQKYYNGTGKSVWLQYKSSVRYYLEDKLQGIRWATRLPFPVHCVSKVTTYDLVSRSRFAQEYKYRHGYYDHEEREFRGFGYVETIDIDSVTAQSPPVPPGVELSQHPVQTRTWYHTGAWMRESPLISAFKKEYFQFEGWDDFVQIASFPAGMTAQEQREAHRALKGSPLRQEVYALDGTEREGIPYTVTATSYKVQKVQDAPPANVKKWEAPHYASFLSLQEQRVAFSCERDPGDPRILHELVLDTDQYGNVLQSAAVAYERKDIPLTLPVKVQEEQAKRHITCTETAFTNDAIDDTELAYYRLRVAYTQKSYELVMEAPAGALYTVEELKTAFDTATAVDYTVTDPGEGEKRLLSQSRALFYADDTESVLAAGTIERLAIPYERYTLAFTPDVLTQCYGTGVTDPMKAETGYVDLDNDEKLWLSSGRATYTDPEDHFYTPERYRDPWGNETEVTYWGDYWLLPEKITDARNNVVSVTAYDWRILQPLRMQDVNDNITEMLYDIIGFPVAMAVKGKDNGTEGDTLAGLDVDSDADRVLQEDFREDPQSYAPDLIQGATWRCVYDLDSLPLGVAMIGRERHHYPSAAPPVAGALLIQFTYPDGFGRVIMQKVQCEATTSNGNKEWIGSGRTIYNNKGNPVMQYEPYFSDSHLCDTAEQAAMEGVTPRLYYDPLGRNYKTLMPDGTFTRTEWTAWEQQVWDANDTVLQSSWYWEREDGAMGPEEEAAAEKAAAHADTPAIIHTDTLARGFYTIQYLSPVTDPIPEAIHSYETLDIQGNRLSVTDGRGLVPLQYRYNMLEAPCLQQSMDSGLQRTLPDAAGQPLYAWDAEDRMFTMEYDMLRRPLQKKVTEDSVTGILEVYVYGEGATDDKERNLRGNIYQVFDGGGLQQINEYDFKGNPPGDRTAVAA
ncbi:MAG: VCBS repeat-containing protein [Taibaiella sp.]|nr:VCBS repeat-containing protein [Taibaiella sp.]